MSTYFADGSRLNYVANSKYNENNFLKLAFMANTNTILPLVENKLEEVNIKTEIEIKSGNKFLGRQLVDLTMSVIRYDCKVSFISKYGTVIIDSHCWISNEDDKLVIISNNLIKQFYDFEFRVSINSENEVSDSSLDVNKKLDSLDEIFKLYKILKDVIISIEKDTHIIQIFQGNMMTEDFLVNHLKLLSILVEIKTESGVEIKPPLINELTKEDVISINDIYRYIVLQPKSWSSVISNDVKIPEVLDGSNGFLYADCKFMNIEYRINFLAVYEVSLTIKDGVKTLSAQSNNPKYELIVVGKI